MYKCIFYTGLAVTKAIFVCVISVQRKEINVMNKLQCSSVPQYQ